MNNTVNMSNQDGNYSFNDINQTVIIDNSKLKNTLDEFNQEWIKKKGKPNKIFQQIENPISFFEKISKRNLFFKNNFFSEKDVYFEDIYVPLDISLSENLIQIKDDLQVENENIIINDKFLIEEKINKNIFNIIGCAGQGKSTVLCKIFLNQIRKGNLIPIYIPFRNINESIILEIQRLFHDHEIECDKGDLVALLRSKKFILLLDAFDEIHDEKLKIDLTNEIKRMNHNYGLSIVCTSRPGTYLCHQSGVDNYDLKDLTFDKVIQIINKTRNIENQTDKILRLIESNQNIKESLRTPLLTVLFVKVYPQMEIIPENARDFYDQIFNLLYIGHDKYKDGNPIRRSLVKKYSRNDTKFTFSLLCFISFLNNKSSFLLEEAEDFLSSGINVFENRIPNGIKSIDLNSFLLEIIECTSLLVFDGVENGKDFYSYLHKTIQEYHAAIFFKEFIKTETSNEQLDFFLDHIIDTMFNDPTDIIEFTKFLYVIDSNFSKKKVLLPFLNKYFFKDSDRLKNIENLTDVIYKNMLENSDINIVSTLKKTQDLPGFSISNDGVINKGIGRYHVVENGKIGLNINSAIREIICAIGYLFDFEVKLLELFSKLMTTITSFKTKDVFPVNEKNKIDLEDGKTINRKFEMTLGELFKNKGYQDTLHVVEAITEEISTIIYDNIYLQLKQEELKMNGKDDKKLESIQSLFKAK